VAATAAASPAAPAERSALGNPFLTVVLPTAVTLLLCNMDRICLSVAILPMAKEFGWAPSFQVSLHARMGTWPHGRRMANLIPCSRSSNHLTGGSPPSHVMQGVVQSAFLWGYMATQLLGGTLADRCDSKPFERKQITTRGVLPELCQAL
jgi:hypothetical protein